MTTHGTDGNAAAARPCTGGVVFVTQLIDPADPTMGFVNEWIRALTRQFSHVAVVANEVRSEPVDIDALFCSLGKEGDAGRARRLLRYWAILLGLLRSGRFDGLLAHMCPSYAVAAWPLTRWLRVPLVLWYAHPSVTVTLRVAEWLSDVIVTSLPGSYPRSNPKVRIIGQATNVTSVEVTSPPPEPPLRLCAIGRTSPAKGLATMVDAVHRCRSRGLDVVLRIVGPSSTEEERRHRFELEALVRDRGLGHHVSIESGVPPAEVADVIRSCHVLVNNMRQGSGDKVVFESLVHGRPTIVSNTAFADLFAGVHPWPFFSPEDPDDLVRRIEEFVGLSPEDRAALAAALRDRVERDHSIDHWASRVLHVVRAAGRQHRPVADANP